MNPLIAELHHNTPEVSIACSTGLPVRQLRFLRLATEEVAPARALSQRTLLNAPTRTQRYYGARPLADNHPDAKEIQSLAGITLYQHSADGDSHLTLYDAVGRPLWQRNAQGTRTRWHYEPAERPGRLSYVTEQGSETPLRIREQFAYGGPDLRDTNQAGTVICHRDNAGENSTLSVSLQGQPLVSQQALLPAESALPDWATSPPVETPLLVSQRCDSTGIVVETTDAVGVCILRRYDISGQLSESAMRWQQNGEQRMAIMQRLLVRCANGMPVTYALGNGLQESYVWHPQTYRLLRHTLTRPATGQREAHTLLDMHYEWDGVGNLLLVHDASAGRRWHRNQELSSQRSFSYDSLSRLMTASGIERLPDTARGPQTGAQAADNLTWSNYTERYRYDNGDNLQEIQHSGLRSWTRRFAISSFSNRRSLLTAEGSTRVTAEEEWLPGGLKKRLDDGRQLRWYADGQLQEVNPVTRDTGDDDRESYCYASGGNRVRKRRLTRVAAGWQSTITTWAGGCERRRRSLSGQISGLDVTISDGGSVRLIQDNLSQKAFLRYRFATFAELEEGETDELGQVTACQRYYPYGGSAGADEEASEVTDRTRRWSGKEQDASGLYYFGWRYYQPESGGWLSADPGGLIDGLNLFRMCRCNPIRYRDNNGMQPQDNRSLYIAFAVIGILAAVVVILLIERYSTQQDRQTIQAKQHQQQQLLNQYLEGRRQAFNLTPKEVEKLRGIMEEKIAQNKSIFLSDDKLGRIFVHAGQLKHAKDAQEIIKSGENISSRLRQLGFSSEPFRRSFTRQESFVSNSSDSASGITRAEVVAQTQTITRRKGAKGNPQPTEPVAGPSRLMHAAPQSVGYTIVNRAALDATGESNDNERSLENAYQRLEEGRFKGDHRIDDFPHSDNTNLWSTDLSNFDGQTGRGKWRLLYWREGRNIHLWGIADTHKKNYPIYRQAR